MTTMVEAIADCLVGDHVALLQENATLRAERDALAAALRSLLNDECPNKQFVNGHPAAAAARAALAGEGK